MYEEIDLDAIESNKDEAPDYRPFLKSSGGLGASVPIDDSRYRSRVLSFLETEERTSYEEFARVADKEGFRKIAGLFRQIVDEEKGHEKELPTSGTLNNLRTSVAREEQKIEIMKSMLGDAEKEGDDAMAGRLRKMIDDESRHSSILSEALREIEAVSKKPSTSQKSHGKEPEMVCNFGKCVEKSAFADDDFGSRMSDGD